MGNIENLDFIGNIVLFLENQRDFLVCTSINKLIRNYVTVINPECARNVEFILRERKLATKISFSAVKADGSSIYQPGIPWDRDRGVEELGKLKDFYRNNPNLNEIKENPDNPLDTLQYRVGRMGKVLESIHNSFGSNRNRVIYPCFNSKPYCYKLTLEKNALIDKTSIVNFYEKSRGKKAIPKSSIFSNVRTLKLYVSNLRNCKTLPEHLPSVTNLILFSGYVDARTPISFKTKQWKQFKSLKQVEFFSCAGVNDAVLSSMSNSEDLALGLEKLVIVGPPPRYQRIANMLLRGDGISKFVNLKVLELMYCNSIRDLSLKNIKSVEDLRFVSCGKVKGYCVNEMNLERLHFTNCQGILGNLLFHKEKGINRRKIKELVFFNCNQLSRPMVLEFMKERTREYLQDAFLVVNKGSDVLEGEIEDVLIQMRDFRVIYEKRNLPLYKIVEELLEENEEFEILRPFLEAK